MVPGATTDRVGRCLKMRADAWVLTVLAVLVERLTSSSYVYFPSATKAFGQRLPRLLGRDTQTTGLP